MQNVGLKNMSIASLISSGDGVDQNLCFHGQSLPYSAFLISIYDVLEKFHITRRIHIC